jgi:hypothetical protein
MNDITRNLATCDRELFAMCDHAKSAIRPESNLVNGLGAPAQRLLHMLAPPSVT